jgi:hypothetical protein
MGKHRGRLDPGEIKRAIADEEQAGAPAEPFHSPFAAARAQLEALAVKPQPKGRKPAAERLRERAGERRSEPSALGKLRAERRAAREALAEAVKPIVRHPRRGSGDGSDGDGGGGDGRR